MKPRKRLVDDIELPKIDFSLDPEALEEIGDELDKRDTFFKSYYDAGFAESREPELRKKLIV